MKNSIFLVCCVVLLAYLVILPLQFSKFYDIHTTFSSSKEELYAAFVSVDAGINTFVVQKDAVYVGDEKTQNDDVVNTKRQRRKSMVDDDAFTTMPPPRLEETKVRLMMNRLQQNDGIVPTLIQTDLTKTWNDVNIDLSISDHLNLTSATVRSNRIVYVITPTYKRTTQIVDLIRLKQTLMLATKTTHERIYWIIIEDSDECSSTVREIAMSSGLKFAHCATKQKIQHKHHKGIEQRNFALDLIINKIGFEGVIYFGDDDNAYDIQLFTELTYTKRVSIFGVGLPSGGLYERCHVNNRTGKVDEIISGWKPQFRTYPIDMAGFAFSTSAMVTTSKNQKQKQYHNIPKFTYKSRRGHLETDFIKLLLVGGGKQNNKNGGGLSNLEPLAANCTKILAWHVRTQESQWTTIPKSEDNKTFQLIQQLV